MMDDQTMSAPLLLAQEVHTEPLPFHFERPASWEIVKTTDVDRGTILQLTGQHQRGATGQITVEVRKKSPELRLQCLVRDHAERLKADGIHLGGAPLIPITPPQWFQRAALFAPTATRDGCAFDAPVLLSEHDDALLLLALLGPTRDESPECWAINKRAFEIVRDSLAVGTPSTENAGAQARRFNAATTPGGTTGNRLLNAGSY
jgi:hypothetical protein